MRRIRHTLRPGLSAPRTATDTARAVVAATARAFPGPLPLDEDLALLAAAATPPPGRRGPRVLQRLAAVDARFAAALPSPLQARVASVLLVAAAGLATAGGFSAAISMGVHRAEPVSRITLALDRLVESRATGAEAVPAPVAPLGTAPPPRHLAAPPAEAYAPPKPVAPPARRGALPVGKGMWLWLPERVEGGDPEAIVARARAVGLTHLYVRTGSSRMGFYAQDFLNRLLPVAHANGIRVYGWDFPYLENPHADVFRAVAAILYTTPDGHRIDGFSADIETVREGVRIDAPRARAYGTALRQAVGPDYPLIATVPRPNRMLVSYPMAEVVAPFDVIAPMVYWMHLDPGAEVIRVIQELSKYGKPVMPVGQAYDGAPEGGPPGVPSRGAILRFLGEAERAGAVGVSFWSWQHANQEAWDAIRDSTWFVLPSGLPSALHPAQIRGYQTLLSGLGFPVAFSGVWDWTMTEAVLAYQREAGLPETGWIDQATRDLLFQPFGPPLP